MISEVIKFENSMVLVFDGRGVQMPEYQGKYNEVRAKILARAPRSTKFYHHISTIRAEVLRKDW